MKKLLFSIKSETENVRYLSGALAEALKDVKLNDEKNIMMEACKNAGLVNEKTDLSVFLIS